MIFSGLQELGICSPWKIYISR